ncbi:MAG: VWA domain-containing protein [Anaerolineae bacterium]|nr:MAG: VWA domain-containing protein [Anaerolineae bacterium]
MTNKDFYQVLGLPRDATTEEIRLAYRELARRLHPDLNPDDSQAEERFLQVQNAYETLSNPAQRRKYDLSLPSEIEGVEFEALYSRPLLPAIPEAQLVYALLKFSAPPAARNTPPPPLNLCLVIDRSTSMSGARMDTVKSTALELLSQLQDNDRLSIVTFSDRAEVILSGGEGSRRKELASRVHMLRASGGTEIYRGLEAGLKEVHRYATPQHINHIILLTDGRTYGDEERSLLLAHKARQFGVGISSLGIGNEWNDVFLDKLANATGGSTTFVAHARDISNYLQERFSALSRAYATQVTYHYTSGEEAQLQYAFRLEPDVMPIEDSGGNLLLGQVPLDGSLKVLLEFLVYPITQAQKRIYLSQGQIKLEIPLRPDPQVVAQLALSRKIGSSEQSEEPPKAIVQALSQITLYRMQSRAQQEIQEGKIEEATRRLQRLATHLLSQGEHKLARTVLSEARQLEHTHALSADGQKRIKYGTRSLLLPEKT